ncbi:hypothetical protein BVE84_06805 [Streptococcus azizii]|uniref:VOC domain-containing protein n=1 Tax=Streptococcus azizii TaxID=1579424 RepID=A0AB36JRC7_9STRE|nr:MULTISPECIES: hypothetical protein [Streptococcus]MBF0775401.1 hypothetical protein [Streptococcus sp. 19428wD3_AN2]ONK26764.1 hypothetical protein BVE86_06625 [Streptococcus azizii]ONK27331.1 hypothetical protein BVE85_06610 [Streptococcus azizii]ONK28275.1 hypothetical protein BVE84_06805 [Streptococcus azizii]TFU84569.1 hypothetical protein E4T83_01230 [Streptococcus sp. AN2]
MASSNFRRRNCGRWGLLRGKEDLTVHGGTRDQVDQWRQDLLARGVKFLYDDRFPHAGGPDHYALYCEDLDGGGRGIRRILYG